MTTNNNSHSAALFQVLKQNYEIEKLVKELEGHISRDLPIEDLRKIEGAQTELLDILQNVSNREREATQSIHSALEE